MKSGVFSTVLVVCCAVLFVGASAEEPYAVRQLTDDPAQDGFPCWSPDGASIVFSRYGGDEAPERTGLYIVSPEGGEPRRLTTVIGEHPNWSRDGRYIAFDGDYGNCIQLVAASGGTPIRIVGESITISKGGQPKWSPDGSCIAFKVGPRVCRLDLASGRVDTVFTGDNAVVLPACWSRDGKDVYVCVREAEGRNASIWAISATGGENRKVTPEEATVYRYADISPDGSMLCVVWCEGRNCDLWGMRSTGGKRVQVTFDPAYDDGPSWSPDGRRIAFVSTRSGHFDIWTVDVDVDRLRGELAALEE